MNFNLSPRLVAPVSALSGLHWFGAKDTHVGGPMGISLDSASITVGLAIVLPELQSGRQHAFTFRALPHQREQRVKAVSLVR